MAAAVTDELAVGSTLRLAGWPLPRALHPPVAAMGAPRHTRCSECAVMIDLAFWPGVDEPPVLSSMTGVTPRRFMRCLPLVAVVPAACRLEFDPELIPRDGDVHDASPDVAVDAPPETNIVFVTASTHQGDLGGLAGADAICASEATAAGLPGTYVAWLSDDTTNAIDRIAQARGWVRVDGRGVADEPSELATTGPRVPIAQTAAGADQRGLSQMVFTGTKDDGTGNGTNCGNWTRSDVGGVDVGEVAGGRGVFTASALQACSQASRLYCFGIDKASSIAAEPVGTPVAFVTRGVWNPATGATAIADADALCAGEASTAGLPGTFKAALANVGTSVAGRFQTRPIYYRTGGGLVGRILEQPTPAGFLYDYADGVQSTVGSAWTGGFPGASATNATTCMNWTSSTATGTVGRPAVADGRLFTRFNPQACDVALPIYCLEDP